MIDRRRGPVKPSKFEVRHPPSTDLLRDLGIGQRAEQFHFGRLPLARSSLPSGRRLQSEAL